MNISILGCGWLGFPLAQHLVIQGYEVKGSTTSREKLDKLSRNGIQPYLIKLTPELENPQSVSSFWESEALVLNIPPGRKRDDVVNFHTAQINSVSKVVANSPIKFVVFVSSTSVYPKFGGLVTEDDAVPGKASRSSGEALLEAEKILTENNAFKTTVLRFGGLIGPDRHPVKYFVGKKDLKRANAPVNLIHRDDCMNILTQIIENNITGKIFNGVSDNHETRKRYYTKKADEHGLEAPTFKEDIRKNYKIVSNEKLKTQLGYKFYKD